VKVQIWTVARSEPASERGSDPGNSGTQSALEATLWFSRQIAGSHKVERGIELHKTTNAQTNGLGIRGLGGTCLLLKPCA